MFPPHVRYASLSIPYHLGTGYFGGFLPLIASFIIAKTGNAYAGLWYTWGVVLIAFLVTALILKAPVEGHWDKPAARPRPLAGHAKPSRGRGMIHIPSPLRLRPSFERPHPPWARLASKS